MANRPFRFIHAADLHLEQPPGGVSEVPDHLRELFTESAYWAAQRVFDAVLADEAQLLVLSGDVLDPTWTGPRGPLFLVEQFRRLAERKIEVYWAGGGVDPPEVWPSLLRLPETVHVFRSGRPQEFVHQHDGEPLVRLIGASRRRGRRLRVSDFRRDRANLFSIGVIHGNAAPAALRGSGIDYWALGGRHSRSTPLSSPAVAHFPGTPQGRDPAQTGPHGCTLVEVDEARQARVSLVPTDVMRWQSERVVVDEKSTQEDLETMLRERMHSLVETIPRTDLLVSWTVAGSGPLMGRLRRGRLGVELLDRLRSEYGFGPPAAWSVALVAESDEAVPPEWYEQQTLRGDFLRAVRHLEMNRSEPLGLEGYLGQSQAAGPLGAAAAMDSKLIRDQVLREAATLGVDLLTGEGSPS